MAALKILIPSFDFKPALGGVAHYVHEVAHHLTKEHNVEALILAPQMSGAFEYDNNAPFAVERFNLPRMALAALPAWAYAIGRSHQRFQPDLILAPLWFPDAAAVRMNPLCRKTRLFTTVHAMEVLPPPRGIKPRLRSVFTSPLKPLVFEHCEKIFAVSNFAKNLIQKNTTAGAEKIKVVNNGVNVLDFHKRSPIVDFRKKFSAEKAKILLTVTRLRPYKGVDKVLQSLPEILKAVPEITYFVVGEGPDRSRLEAMAKTLGVSAHVHFLGALSQSEIIDLYNSVDLFVMLSRQEEADVEGFGLVFLEAAACGLPSLGGDSGGIPDAIENEKSGWLINPNETAQISAKIISLLKTPQSLSAAAEYGIHRARERTWSNTVATMMESFRG